MPTLSNHMLGGSDGNTSLIHTTEKGSLPLLSPNDIVELIDKTAGITLHEKTKEYLACPFWKHDPLRYVHVNNACTEGVGFKDVGKLTEHIRRVHCLRFGCEKCRMRFTKCKAEDVDEEKRKHVAHCAGPQTQLTKLDPEWMTEAQDAEYRLLNFQKNKGTPRGCYEKICRAIFGQNSTNEISEPYHQPGFHISVFRLVLFRDLDQQILAMSQGSLQGKQNPATPTTTANIGSAPLQQSLGNLPNESVPFYRNRTGADSGIYSWAIDSDDQPPCIKPSLLEPGLLESLRETRRGNSLENSGYSDYIITGTWTGSQMSGPNGISSIDIDQDAGDNDPCSEVFLDQCVYGGSAMN
ncbi:hypothetical protein AAE478_004569 [Parahypoxylon ruwenzoriense]